MSELEKQWETIQVKTFTNWINAYLRKAGESIADIEKDLSDGLKLIKLLEIISGESITGYEKRPRMRVQQVINVGAALKFIEAHGVRLAGIGPEEIVDHNRKMILGMVWTIILRFAIQDISEEELSAKEGLLLWCRKQTKNYRDVDPPGLNNFHKDWQNGMAFCALIHKFRPDLVDYDSLDKENAKENLEYIFEIADKHLDVPKLLDPEDIVNIPKPDERSIMTYVAQLYHVFASGMQAQQAAKNVADALDFNRQMQEMQNDYARRAAELVEWINDATQRLEERDFPNSLAGVQQKMAEFKVFKREEKVPKGQEKTDLEALFNNIQTKLRVNNRAPYVPPAGLTPNEIDALWQALNVAENERAEALREEFKRQKYLQSLVDRFNARAKNIESWLSSRQDKLQGDDVGSDLATVNANLRNHEAFEEDHSVQGTKVEQLSSLVDEIVNGNHSEADAVKERYANLSSSHKSVGAAGAERKERLLAELEKLQKVQDLLVEFAKLSLAFVRNLEDSNDQLSEPISVDTVEEVAELNAALETIQSNIAEEEGKMSQITSLGQEIQAMDLDETTYSEYSLDDVETTLTNVKALVEQRTADLAEEKSRQEAREALRVQWAEAAGPFHAWMAEVEQKISAPQSGTIDEQIEAAKVIVEEVHGKSSEFDALVGIHQQVEDAEIVDNPHTEVTFEVVKIAYDRVKSLAQSAVQVLENEKLEKEAQSISPEDLAEYRECFDHFDKDKNGELSRLELLACLKSLGHNVSDDAIAGIIRSRGTEKEDGEYVLNFDQFVKYMVDQKGDSDSASSIKESFKVMANDKEFITEQDLRSCGMEEEKVQYMLENMPPYEGVEGGYDYNAFADSLYAQ